MSLNDTSGMGLELKEMINLIERQQNLISSLGEKGAHLDETKESLSKEVEDLRNNLNAVSLELGMANAIIQKLQEEGGQISRKLKTQENIMSSQDAQLKAKEERIVQSTTALSVANERVAKLESELEIINVAQSEMKERIKNFEEALATKESMVTYLSKQLIDSEAATKQMIYEITLLRENNQKLESELNEMKSGHGNLDGQLKIAEENLFGKENIIANLTKKLEDSEGLTNLMSHEIQNLRKNNGKLDSDYHEKQRILANLLKKTEGMETELREKTALISRQQDLISNLGEKGVQLETRKDTLERDVDDLKIHIRELSSELAKANEIIRKLQDDGRNLTRKINAQETVLISQENQLKNKSDGLNKSSTALKSALERMATLESEVDELKRLRHDLEASLKKSTEVISEKENLVIYFSKKLNDYEGLANIEKFRQTLSLSTSQQQHQNTTIGKNQNTTAPSWMETYNSTFGGSPSMNPIPNPAISQPGSKEKDEGKKKTGVPVFSATRAPAWTKSTKATLDNLVRTAAVAKR